MRKPKTKAEADKNFKMIMEVLKEEKMHLMILFMNIKR